jgi:hypothetical protein
VSATGIYVADIVQSLSGITQSLDTDVDVAADAAQTLSSLSQNALLVYVRNADITQTLAGLSQEILLEPTAPSLKVIDFDNAITQLVTKSAGVTIIHTDSQRIFRSS